MSLESEIAARLAQAKAAARELALCSGASKQRALTEIVAGLRAARSEILAANRSDLERARAESLNAAFVDRLALNEDRIEAMARGVEQVAALPDPVGEIIAGWRRPNGLEITQVRIPLGVIAIIYEARPNVTVDAAVLALKAGNAVVLRGGREALAGSAVPVLPHFDGICHTYVDRAADLKMAEEVCFNAKCSRPSVCNAMENLLVHADVAAKFLPAMAARLASAGVELRGCPRTCAILKSARPATDADWDTEYLDLILAIKVVDSIDEALTFIARHGSGLADAIVTEDLSAASRFQHEVDSATVYVNASTRFTDGFEFGFGAETGISTNRLHARGPMGLRELTTYKYVIRGAGQVRQ